MTHEKKTSRVTSSVTEQTESILTLVAKREGKTLSEYLNDILEPIVQRELDYLSVASTLNIVNVNNISAGYTVNQRKKAMYSTTKRPDLKLVASN